MKKKILLKLFFFSLISISARGQTIKDTSKHQRNTIYFEFLGNGGLYSLNYDRIIYIHEKIKISAKTGISYTPPLFYSYSHVFKYPTSLNFIYGKKNAVEIGIGYTPVFSLYKKDIFKVYQYYSSTMVNVGYRYQKKAGGFFFKTGLTLYLTKSNFTKNHSINNISWLFVGLGHTFKNKK